MKQNPIYTAALAQWKANPGQAVYVSLNDKAKLMRALLKAKFPNTKFSVRGSKYAGGSSMQVAWDDGPTQALVDNVIGGFEAGAFDGMIDVKYSGVIWIYPDGRCVRPEH